MKKILVVFLLSIVVFSCKKELQKQTNLIDFTPNKPTAIVYSNSIPEIQHLFSNNDFFNTFKNTKTYKNIQQEYQFLDNIKSENNVLISYATVGKKLAYLLTIKTKNTQANFEKEEKQQYNGITYYKLKNQDAFTLTIDSTLVVSSSVILLENLIRNQKDNIKCSDAKLLKLYQTNTAKTAIFLNAVKLPTFAKTILPTSFLGSKGWMAIDVENKNGMLLSGIVSSDNIPNTFIQKIINTPANESEIATVLPKNTTTHVSYNFEELSNTTSQFEHFDKLLSVTSEIASFTTQDGNLCAFKVTNTEVLEHLQEDSTYRNVIVYKNNYYKIPTSIINYQPEFACFLGDFMVLSKTKKELQNCIAHYQNKTTLSAQSHYKNSKKELLQTAHIELVQKTKLLQNQLADNLNDASIKKVNLSNYPVIIHQVTFSEGYAQFNTVLQKTKKMSTNKGVTQIADLQLDADLAMQPQWVINHKNKAKEILVQDVNHVLYLFSSNGKMHWKKQLKSAIQGKIHQIDIYKNRKLQLAFTTQNEFMVLDRNGKLVQPFYKEFKNKKLLPLAVFDYDNTRNYRFVITQEKKVLMFDKHLKPVKGFKFKKTKSNILQAPKHIRLGTKDYIVIAEEKGKIHILNRQGKDRTKVKQQFEIGNIPLQFTKNNIILVDIKNNIQQINVATGAVKKIDILQENANHFVVKNKIKVKLEDRNLTINSKTIELEYGTYTQPNIQYIKGIYYISVTDLDTQKVWMYTPKGKLLPNFPVYGKSEATITRSQKRILFAVLGDEKSVLIYEIK